MSLESWILILTSGIVKVELEKIEAAEGLWNLRERRMLRIKRVLLSSESVERESITCYYIQVN